MRDPFQLVDEQREGLPLLIRNADRAPSAIAAIEQLAPPYASPSLQMASGQSFPAFAC